MYMARVYLEIGADFERVGCLGFVLSCLDPSHQWRNHVHTFDLNLFEQSNYQALTTNQCSLSLHTIWVAYTKKKKRRKPPPILKHHLLFLHISFNPFTYIAILIICAPFTNAQLHYRILSALLCFESQ